MNPIFSFVLKTLGAGLFNFIDGWLKGRRRDNALKKLGYLEAKEKSDGRKIKVLKKVEKHRSRLRTDLKFRNKLRSKYTRR